MEDAHVAHVDLHNHPLVAMPESDQAVSVFAVFDGHGGKHVSRFVQDRYVDTLIGLSEFRDHKFAEALVESFHIFDEMLENIEHEEVLKQYRLEPSPSDKVVVSRRPSSHKSLDSLDSSSSSDKANKTKAFAEKLLSIRPTLLEKILGTSDAKASEEDASASAPVPAAEPVQSEPISALPEQKIEGTLPSPPTFSKVNGVSRCNLEMHRVSGGCTAVVALLLGQRLYVANAGDSRAVLCRGNNEAVALSEDHKPFQVGAGLD